MAQLTPIITTYQPQGKVKGFLLSKDSLKTTINLGKYCFEVTHEYKLGWSAGASNKDWPLAGGLLIQVAEDEFYVAGTGFVVTAQTTEAGRTVGILSTDEGSFNANGQWQPGRRMNGDQDHQGRHIRIAVGEHGIQHVKWYTY